MYKFLGYNRVTGVNRESGETYDYYKVTFARPFDSSRSSDCAGDQVFSWSVSPQAFASLSVHPSDIGRLCHLSFDPYKHLERVEFTD